MYLKEISCRTEGLGCQRHGRHEPAVADGLPVSCARTLHTVRTVHDDTWDNLLHVRDVAEVDYKIVVAEAVTAFREPYLSGPAFHALLYRIAHIAPAEELRFLYVDRLSRPGSSYKQVGLPAEESGNLNDIHDPAHGLCLAALVYIRQ